PYADTAHTNNYQFSQGAGYVLPEYAAVVPEAVKTGATEHHRVLIVGAGLAGLTLACSLAQLGIDCVVVDEDNTVGVKGASSRGICYTQKSLEIFDKLGIYRRIQAKGVEWSVGRTFAGRDEVYRFDLKKQNNFNLSQQPAFINIQQFYNEAFLVDRIAELGHAQIRWNNRVTQYANDAGLATLTIATQAGEYKTTADFLIDATGSKSPFRQWLGIGVKAQKGDDRWCIADVRFTTRPPKERHTWIEAPFNDNRAVWQHLMADDVWRIDYQMAPDADPEVTSSPTQVRERLARQFGKDTPVEIVWVGPYAYRSECVQRMQVDLAAGLTPPTAATRSPNKEAHSSQVFLIGDSAKVMSPFGARGGNSGIADADNLAWKLAAVVKGQASPTLLASYHPERHEAATTNVQVTHRTARFLRPADGVERLFRSAVIDLAKQHPFARSLVNTGRMAVANPYSASPLTDSSLKRSISVQNVGLQWVDGAAASLNDLLRWAGTRPLLLVFGDGTGVLSNTQVTLLGALASANLVRVVQVSTQRAHVQAREAVLDAKALLARACGMPHPQQAVPASALTTCHWALLRPDSYLAARGTHVGGSLVRAVARCAGVNLQGARP
ncbi:MAG: FAD-dependent oxidoreductase, partial [Burkholderiaceae bacterium]